MTREVNWATSQESVCSPWNERWSRGLQTHSHIHTYTHTFALWAVWWVIMMSEGVTDWAFILGLFTVWIMVLDVVQSSCFLVFHLSISRSLPFLSESCFRIYLHFPPFHSGCGSSSVCLSVHFLLFSWFLPFYLFLIGHLLSWSRLSNPTVPPWFTSSIFLTDFSTFLSWTKLFLDQSLELTADWTFFTFPND